MIEFHNVKLLTTCMPICLQSVALHFVIRYISDIRYMFWFQIYISESRYKFWLTAVKIYNVKCGACKQRGRCAVNSEKFDMLDFRLICHSIIVLEQGLSKYTIGVAD